MSSQFYWVGLSYVLVGGVSVKTMTMAVFDTGTTYTYLATPAYNSVMAVVRPVLYTGSVYVVQIELEELFISVALELLSL